jgi:hypothetical protein
MRLLGMKKTFIAIVNGIPLEIEIKIRKIYVSEDAKRKLKFIS